MVAVIIIVYSLLFVLWAIIAISGVWVIGEWIRERKRLRELEGRKKKDLKCFMGKHEWRYVRINLRRNECYDSPHRPCKIFSISHYNKKVEFVIKYCLKCLKPKAEKA